MPFSLVPLQMLGGVNLRDDPRRIRDDQVIRSKNLIPLKSGLMGKRDGVEFVEYVFEEGTVRYPTNLFFPSWPSTKRVYTYESADSAVTETMLCASNGTSSEGTAGFGGHCEGRPVAVAANGKLYVFAGAPATKSLVVEHEVGSTSGAKITTFAFSGTGNGSVVPRGACLYRNRMVYWDFGPGYQDVIVWADRDEPTVVGDDVLAANGRNQIIGEVQGDRVVACVEVMLTAVGSPAESALLVLKEKSAYVLTGEPTETDDAAADVFGDTTVSRVSFDCGCVSPHSVVRTSYGTFWASADDVWLFDAGHVPRKVGSLIRPALEETGPSDRKWWHAEYHNGFYRLAVKPQFGTTGTTVVIDGFTTEVTSPRDVVMAEQWWLDLRNGAPPNEDQARWFGPHIYNISGNHETAPTPGTRIYAVDRRHGFDTKLLGLERGRYYTTNDLLNSVSYDVPGLGRDRASDPELPGIRAYNGNEINFEVFFKEADFDDPMNQKIYQGLEVNLWSGKPVQLAVELHVDGGRVVRSLTENCYPEGFVLGLDTVDFGDNDARMSRQFNSVVIHPDSATRTLGKTLQVRLSSNSKYLIHPDRNKFDFRITPVFTYTATITAGEYADMDAILSALATAMTSISGATFTAASPASGGNYLIELTGTSQWRPYLLGDNTDSTEWMLTLLGYDPATSFAFALTHTSVESVEDTSTTPLELGGLIMRARAITRRPA